MAVFSALSPSFATVDNLANVLRQVSITAIIATGLTFVILTAEIDLSVAAIANVAGIIGRVLHACRNPTSTSPTCRCRASSRSSWRCSPASALGLVTAFGVTVIGIPSFIMTLAMLQIGAGICAMLVRGQIAYAVPPLDQDAGLGHASARSRGS